MNNLYIKDAIRNNMKYECKLALRVILAFALVLMPVDLFYVILLKPTLNAANFFLAGYDGAVVGDALVINDVLLRFIPACVASLAYVLLLILVLMTKDIGLRRGARMFLVGSLAIFAANIARIDLLIYVYLEYGSDLFSKIHLFLWDVVSSLFVAALWIIMVHAYKIKSIPVYSDAMFLYRKIKRN